MVEKQLNTDVFLGVSAWKSRRSNEYKASLKRFHSL